MELGLLKIYSYKTFVVNDNCIEKSEVLELPNYFNFYIPCGWKYMNPIRFLTIKKHTFVI